MLEKKGKKKRQMLLTKVTKFKTTYSISTEELWALLFLEASAALLADVTAVLLADVAPTLLANVAPTLLANGVLLRF